MAAKVMEIYKCEGCGNIVEVFQGGEGSLYCCGAPMKNCEAKTADSATEKHVPVIEKTDDGIKVTVGSTLHPMEEEHYIQWIELKCGHTICRAELKPGDEPAALFPACSKCGCQDISAREYCNKHGLWADK